jgi:hypothetical protein
MTTATESKIEYMKKLDKLESELVKLKKFGGTQQFVSVPLSLKGAWKDVEVTDEDITIARSSLFTSGV